MASGLRQEVLQKILNFSLLASFPQRHELVILDFFLCILELTKYVYILWIRPARFLIVREEKNIESEGNRMNPIVFN